MGIGKRRGGRKVRAFYTTDLKSNETFCVSVEGRDLRHLQTYVEAHVIYPECDLRGDRQELLAAEALGSLARLDAEPPELLRAVVILGHVPTRQALEALAAYGRSNRPYAGVARVALGECAGMIGIVGRADAA